MSRNLTQLAHELAGAVLRAGDRAVDATAGNGHDTVFLAEAVGATGRVFAFDIQQAAQEATRLRLEKMSLAARVSLVLDGHETMERHLPPAWRGAVSAVFFNLGYLPRGDHDIITRSETTLPALTAAAEFLRPGGHLSLLVYPGHPGGAAESGAVWQWVEAARGRFEFSLFGDPQNGVSPWLAAGVKRG